jgi:HEAT repeat protein
MVREQRSNMGMRWTLLGGGFLALLLGACQPHGAVNSALQSDLPTLRRDILAERKEGQLDEERAKDISRAVLEREIHTASGSAGVARVRSVRSCAEPLYGSLRDRAEKQDDVGAEAALILFEHKKLEGQLARYGDSPDGAWRAVAARDTEGPKAAGRRVGFFTDPDERVRRAALQAAVAATDPRDQDALLEVARLDPDPMCRSLAVQALGRIGGERAVLGLQDRWERSDESLRLVIVDAWATPGSMRAGGRIALLRLAETSSGLPALRAAQALSKADPEIREIGLQKLFDAARNGTREERRMALTILPADRKETLSALDDAVKGTDKEVAVLAWARLLDFPDRRPQAKKELSKLAAGKDSLAIQARAALSAAQDPSVAPLLVKQLDDSRAALRQSAAFGLIRLDKPADAAVVLADPSPSVRTQVACQMLVR